MNNKIYLIKDLRTQVKNLTIFRDELKTNYNTCLQKIKNTEAEINTMEEKWNNDIKLFDVKWQKKLGIHLSPIYVVLALFLGRIFCKELGTEITDYILGYSCGTIFAFIPFYNDTVMHDIYFNCQDKHQQRIINRRRKYLFKKYPYIEKMYNELYSLVEEIQTKTVYLEQLKIEEKELQTKLQDIYNLLSSKKEEIIELEREYINITSGNNMENEIEKDNTINDIKSKTRVRRLEDN